MSRSVPMGIRLRSGSYPDNTVRLWDANTGQHNTTITGHTGGVFSVAFSPDGNTLASGSWDNTVRLWDANTGQQNATITGHRGAWSIVSRSVPMGIRLQVGVGTGGTVRLWDAKTGQQKATLTGHTGLVNSVAFSPDGNTIASGSYGPTIRCGCGTLKRGSKKPLSRGIRGELVHKCSVQSRWENDS